MQNFTFTALAVSLTAIAIITGWMNGGNGLNRTSTLLP